MAEDDTQSVGSPQHITLPSNPKASAFKKYKVDIDPEPEDSDVAFTAAPKKRTPRPVSKRKPKQAPAVIDEESKTQLHLLMTAAVGALCILVISDPEYVPTETEMDSILSPLENLILRRVHIAGVLSPDFNDIIVLVFGVVTYGARIKGIRKSRGVAKRPVAKNTRGNVQGNSTGTSDPVLAFPGVGQNWDAIDGVEASINHG